MSLAGAQRVRLTRVDARNRSAGGARDGRRASKRFGGVARCVALAKERFEGRGDEGGYWLWELANTLRVIV